jgi:hypothetical protein
MDDNQTFAEISENSWINVAWYKYSTGILAILIADS